MDANNSFPAPAHSSPKLGEPAWGLALMFPLQGGWSVEDYLRLDGGLLVEYTDEFIGVLPIPSLIKHHLVVDRFHVIIRADFVEKQVEFSQLGMFQFVDTRFQFLSVGSDE